VKFLAGELMDKHVALPRLKRLIARGYIVPRLWQDDALGYLTLQHTHPDVAELTLYADGDVSAAPWLDDNDNWHQELIDVHDEKQFKAFLASVCAPHWFSASSVASLRCSLCNLLEREGATTALPSLESLVSLDGSTISTSIFLCSSSPAL